MVDRLNTESLVFIKKSSILIDGLIGGGGFGLVWLGHTVENPTQYLAIKSIKKVKSTTREIERLKEEAIKLRHAQHENVVKIFGVCHDLKQDYGIVMEHMPRGSLSSFIEETVTLGWPLKLRFLKETACGMAHLHGLNPVILHCDLSPGNILLTTDYHIKICDFGLSVVRTFDSISSCYKQGVGGKPEYIPPENLLKPNKKHTKKFDVYSFGIVVWEITTQEKPYKYITQKNKWEILSVTVPSKSTQSGQRPDLSVIPEDARHSDVCGTLRLLMERCWADSADDRPLFDGCVDTLNPMCEGVSDADIENSIEMLPTHLKELDGVSEYDLTFTSPVTLDEAITAEHIEVKENSISRQIMGLFAAILFAIAVGVYIFPTKASKHEYCADNIERISGGYTYLNLMPTKGWQARPLKSTPNRVEQFSHVVVGHTAGFHCNNTSECCNIVDGIQRDHMNPGAFNFDNIGYNFLIGEDGVAYEGRGLFVEGAHTKRWNKKGLGIGIIGTYNERAPNSNILPTLRELINYAIREGSLSKDYILYGQCQVRCGGSARPGTKQEPIFDSPGKKMFSELQKEQNWEKGGWYANQTYATETPDNCFV